MRQHQFLRHQPRILLINDRRISRLRRMQEFFKVMSLQRLDL